MAYLCEKLLTHNEGDKGELILDIKFFLEELFSEHMDTNSLNPEVARRFYEQVRPVDVLFCISRMRGVRIK